MYLFLARKLRNPLSRRGPGPIINNINNASSVVQCFVQREKRRKELNIATHKFSCLTTLVFLSMDRNNDKPIFAITIKSGLKGLKVRRTTQAGN